MTTRRSRGDGGLHWNEARKRWIATASLGHHPDGTRNTKRASGRTKTEAKTKLKELLASSDTPTAEHEDPADCTVEQAVTNWLDHGLADKDPATVKNYRTLSNTHIIPTLGDIELNDLTIDHIEAWLAAKAKKLSTRTLKAIHSCLNRSAQRALIRGKATRNVVTLCTVPPGQPGRPSKAFTRAQTAAILDATRNDRLHAYLVLSLLTGARTEELRALTWDNVDLEGNPQAEPPIPPHIAVRRSVRRTGDTKTHRSRRTLALPARCVTALTTHRTRQRREYKNAGLTWRDTGLVFTTTAGTPMDAANVRRAFRRALATIDGIDPAEWTPREGRPTFVSVLSDDGITTDKIAPLVGHSSTSTTERIYRKQIRPVVQTGAVVIDRIFTAKQDR
ncbi:site-specific integrase [Streptomyces sp. SBT349]|uniref:site-specific integrase n=1 Tax=Streptomyces sp. SBT349 TaxID=1580539 RepID=UPI00066BC126|nr:site-specific integrase [Streptomyces sp. SBT349]